MHRVFLAFCVLSKANDLSSKHAIEKSKSICTFALYRVYHMHIHMYTYKHTRFQMDIMHTMRVLVVHTILSLPSFT